MVFRIKMTYTYVQLKNKQFVHIFKNYSIYLGFDQTKNDIKSRDRHKKKIKFCCTYKKYN